MTDLVKCAREECNNTFDLSKSRHNQKYCSTECSTKENNAKILKKYHERRARMSGKVRECATPGCKTKLSRYNGGNICGGCETRMKEERRQNILKGLSA